MMFFLCFHNYVSKMHYYKKIYDAFFCVFIIMYLKNALLDMCIFSFYGHI